MHLFLLIGTIYDIAMDIIGTILSFCVFLVVGIYCLAGAGMMYMRGETPDNMSSYVVAMPLNKFSNHGDNDGPIAIKLYNNSAQPVIIQSMDYLVYDCPSPNSKLSDCKYTNIPAHDDFTNSQNKLQSGLTIGPHSYIIVNSSIGTTYGLFPENVEVDYVKLRAVSVLPPDKRH